MTTATCSQCNKIDFAPTLKCKACGTAYDDATQAQILLGAVKEAHISSQVMPADSSPVGRVCQKCGHVHSTANFQKTERCPSCGAIFSHVAASIAKSKARATQQTANQPGVLGTIITAACLLILFRSCMGTDNTGSTQPGIRTEAAVSPSQPAIQVTASELFSAYDANEVSADSRYLGRRLIVRGVVQSIDSGISGPIVSLQTTNEFMPVRADDLPTSTAAILEKGQFITVDCSGGGATLGSPWLRSCSLQ